MADWTFLTNHAQVLLRVAQNGRSTAREIAGAIGITERAVQRLLSDLEIAGYIHRQREGRRNRYEIHPEQPLRHPRQSNHAVRELLDLLSASED